MQSFTVRADIVDCGNTKLTHTGTDLGMPVFTSLIPKHTQEQTQACFFPFLFFFYFATLGRTSISSSWLVPTEDFQLSCLILKLFPSSQLPATPPYLTTRPTHPSKSIPLLLLTTANPGCLQEQQTPLKSCTIKKIISDHTHTCHHPQTSSPRQVTARAPHQP